MKHCSENETFLDLAKVFVPAETQLRSGFDGWSARQAHSIQTFIVEKLARAFEKKRRTLDARCSAKVITLLVDFFGATYPTSGLWLPSAQTPDIELHWPSKGRIYAGWLGNLPRYCWAMSTGETIELLVVRGGEWSRPPDLKHFWGTPVLELLDVHLDMEENRLNAEFGACSETGREAAHKSLIAAERGILRGVPKSWAESLGRAAACDGETTDLRHHLKRFMMGHGQDVALQPRLAVDLTSALDRWIAERLVQDWDQAEALGFPETFKVFRALAVSLIDELERQEEQTLAIWHQAPRVVSQREWVGVESIPDELRATIRANAQQRDAWARVLGIDSKAVDASSAQWGLDRRGLLVDTAFFSAEFAEALRCHLDVVGVGLTGILIHGENGRALSLMSEWEQRPQCIYIDPPYNTSEDTFVYRNLYARDAWLNLMESRLSAAIPLLSSDGIVEVAIDDHESSTLIWVLDELLGVENRICSFAAEVNPAGQNLKPNAPALSHDYCHVYAKNPAQMNMNLRPLTPQERLQYPHVDRGGKFRWDNLRRRGGNSRRHERPRQWYPLYATLEPPTVALEDFPGSTEVWPVDRHGEERVWRVIPERARAEILEGEISIISKGKGFEVVKKTHMPAGRKPKTLWKDPRHSGTTHGSKLLKHMLGAHRFSYPKSVHLVEDCLRYFSRNDAWILDFFAGSGTTAHAVLNLNREDEGQRKFILVEAGPHFWTALVPRVQKAVLASHWKDGRPVSNDPVSQRIRVMALDSFSAALDSELRHP